MMKTVVTLAATIWLLVIARDVLQPLAIAVLLWMLLNAMARLYSRCLEGTRLDSPRVARTATAATFCLAFLFVGGMLADSVQQLRSNLPVYEDNLDNAIAKLSSWVGLNSVPQVADLVKKIDFSSVALSLAGSAASYLSLFLIVIFYLIFILMETGQFERKIAKMMPDKERQDRIALLLEAIRRSIEAYIGVQFLIGLIQATATFIVLMIFGVDAALFWSVSILILSFIPTIGTLLGILFPSLIALLQFDSLTPFLVIAPTLTIVQLYCSNWLQPRLTGKSLNLSPLAVFLALFVGGAIWGIVGALIVVPVLSIAVLVCAHVEQLRPIAIALSQDGTLPHLDEGETEHL